MKDKNVVVTGGLGFIGTHLVEALAPHNTVTIIDDLTTGREENIAELNKHYDIRLIRESITNLNLKPIFKDQDYVFHQAALVSVPESVSQPLIYNQVNVNGTLKVLIAARDSGVEKVIFASSSAVYGDSQALPHKESAPLKPLSPYAANKAAGEMYCQVFNESYGLSTVALRYFNVFGPRQDPHSAYAAAIPKFIYSLLKKRQPIIYGDGEQSRDFIFVKDVVRANILLAQSSQNGIFNVGSGVRITINELMRIIEKILDINLEPVYKHPRPGDIKHSYADISRLKALGFHPQDFHKSLEETVNWFITNKDL